MAYNITSGRFYGPPGGTIETYQAGTLTPLATYTTAAGTTPNPTTIAIPASGYVPVWGGEGLAYRFIVKDADGVTVYDQDNISNYGSTGGADVAALEADLASSSTALVGAGMIGFNASRAYGAGTVGEKLRETVSVRDFGAKGDGSTDDTAAIQAALNYAATINGCTVYMPAGTYRVTSSLTFTGHSTRLVGAGRGIIPGTYVLDDGGTQIDYTGSGRAIDFNGKHYCEVADFTLRSITASVGIYCGDIAHFFQVNRVVIDGQNSSAQAIGFSSAGIVIERSYYGTVQGCDIAYCAANGIYGFRECNGNFIIMNSIRQCGTGIRITDDVSNSDGTQIICNEIESARTDPGAGYAITLLGADSMMVIGNRIEWNPNGHIYINSNVSTAQFNQLIGNVLEGLSPSIILGDGTGSAQVVATLIEGGRGAGAVTINSDCIYTKMIAAPSSYGGTFTDNGYGSIIDIDPNAGLVYTRNLASNTSRGYRLTVGGAATQIDTGTNYLDVVNSGGTHTRFEASGLMRVAQGSIAAGGDSGGTSGCNTLTSVANVAARSTGVGTIKFTDATARDNAGFMKVYVGATAYWVPIFAAA